MKKLWILLFALAMLLPGRMGAVIVNNSGSTGADSISFPFFALDSAGNMIAMASGDSVFIRVWYPSGALAFEDSLAYNGAKITTETQHGISTYTWKEAVATIDGTARDGVYAWEILVHDLTGAAIWTPHNGQFQLYQTYDYDTWADRIVDSLQAALDSAQALMAKLIIVQDTTQGTKDLLDAGLTVTVGTNNDKTEYSLTTAERAAIEDSVHAQAADYKATGFSTHVPADIWSVVTRALTDKVGFALTTQDWSTHSALDVWNIAFNTAFTVASMGDSLNNSTYVQGSAGTLTATQVADTVWKSLFTARDDVAGSFADSASGWGATSAGSLDSAFHSRLLGRKIFGIAAGVGSDSVAYGLRHINMASISGDATAADNLETMLDGTGGQEFSLGKLDISGANGTTGSFAVVNTSGNAVVFDASSYATGGGFVVRGGSTDYGFHAIGGAGGIFAEATSVSGSAGITAIGEGTGSGFYGLGGATGDGFFGEGGVTSGSGLRLKGPGTSPESYGMYVTALDTGIYVNATDADVIPDWSGGGSLDSATVQGAVIAALNVDTTINMRSLRVDTIEAKTKMQIGVTTSAGVNGAFQIQNGTGPAAYFRSDFAGSSGAALWLRGRAGAHALYASTDSVGVSGSEVSGPTIYITAPDTANAIYVANTSGDSTAGAGLRIIGEGGDAVVLVAGILDSLAWTTHPNYGLQIEGRIYIHGRENRDEGAILILADDDAVPLAIQASESAEVIRISGNDGSVTAADTVIKITGGMVTHQFDIVVQGDTIAVLEDSSEFRADISLLALQTEVVNLNGWNPATDSVNIDMSAWTESDWAENLIAFIGWGEVNGLPVWSQDRPNTTVDTLFVGWHLAGSAIDTAAAQMIWHVSGAADDPPDSTTSILW